MNIEKNLLISILAGYAAFSSYFLLKSYFAQKQQKRSSNHKQTQQKNYHSNQYLQIKEQQLARVIKYFGPQKFKTMEKSYVIIFGVGGVGSHVANMLARSGVQNIKIVDFDRVSLSSLNRHSFALRKDVGMSKVECLQKYIKQILPHINVQTIEKYVTVENAAQLLKCDQGKRIDYVIDCIDNLDAKVELIRLCKQREIKLICSGGAGMKNDPTKLQIRDISDCKYDNLILRLKRQLTKKGIKSGVKVAFSYQQAEKELLPLEKEQEDNPQGFKVFDNYRIRIVPVLGTMPAILGMTIASYVLCQLAGQPYTPFQTDYVKSTAVNKIYSEFINDEKRNGVSPQNMIVDIQEISILAKAVYKWKSLISDKKSSHPRMVRWQKSKPASIDNLALMNRQQYQKHIKLTSVSEGDYSQQVIDRFTEKSNQALQLYNKGFMMFL